MGTIPTIKICHPESPDHWLIINQSEYDPSKHEAWKADDQLTTNDVGFEIPKKDVVDTEDRDAKEYRRIELESMDWRQLKTIAEGLDIEKPEGGWDESIDLILEVEFNAHTE